MAEQMVSRSAPPIGQGDAGLPGAESPQQGHERPRAQVGVQRRVAPWCFGFTMCPLPSVVPSRAEPLGAQVAGLLLAAVRPHSGAQVTPDALATQKPRASQRNRSGTHGGRA